MIAVRFSSLSRHVRRYLEHRNLALPRDLSMRAFGRDQKNNVSHSSTGSDNFLVKAFLLLGPDAPAQNLKGP